MSIEASTIVTPGLQPPQRALVIKNVSRKIVLLLILAVTGAAAIYDVAFARPAIANAEKKIVDLVAARSQLSAEQGGLITPTDIHQALGGKPTWIERHSAEGYAVEYYCWWGHAPLINVRRHFLAVVYAGDGSQLVFSSHHVNQQPPREALPVPFVEKRPLPAAHYDTERLPQKDRRLLRHPIAAAWIEPHKLLAIANERSGSISIADFPNRKVLDEIVIGERLADFAVHPLGKWFFAVDPHKNELIILRRDKDTFQIIDRRRVGMYPVSIAISPGGEYLSVSSLWSRKLAIFRCLSQGDSDQIIQLAEISLPFNPREHEFFSETVLAVNDAYARRSCEVNVETRSITMRAERTVAHPDPSIKAIKGIAARSEIRSGNERVISADFSITLGPAPVPSSEERGEELFFSRQLAPTGQSCHDCHPFGHSTYESADTLADGTTGTPKRILTLLGTSQTYPWAWNGAINELDDQVRKSLESTLHVKHVTAQQVIDINSFLHSLSPPPPLEPATDVADDRAQLQRGHKLFQDLGCGKCHVPTFTYTSGEVFDVGFSDEKGLSTFNPPSLLGVSQGYSFFHDGRAETLEEVFAVYGHQISRELSKHELADLLRFLRSL